MDTKKRVFELLTKTNKSANALEKEIGLTKSAIYNWENKRCNISLEHAIKLATYFNVTTDYLLCLTDIPNIYEELKTIKQTIPNIILDNWKNLSDSQKLLIKNMLNTSQNTSNTQSTNIDISTPSKKD